MAAPHRPAHNPRPPPQIQAELLRSWEEAGAARRLADRPESLAIPELVRALGLLFFWETLIGERLLGEISQRTTFWPSDEGMANASPQLGAPQTT